MVKRFVVTLGFLALVMLMANTELTAQRLSYTSGENVSPGYEGWEEDADGSRWFVFGYMNRNWEEEPEEHLPWTPTVAFLQATGFAATAARTCRKMAAPPQVSFGNVQFVIIRPPLKNRPLR